MGAGVHLCVKFTRTHNTKKIKKSQNLQRTTGEGMCCSMGIISSNVVV